MDRLHPNRSGAGHASPRTGRRSSHRESTGAAGAGLSMHDIVNSNPIDVFGRRSFNCFEFGGSCYSTGRDLADEFALDAVQKASKRTAPSASKKPNLNQACFSLATYRQNHDQWVASEAARLRSAGFLVATEVSLLALDPSQEFIVQARADIIFTTPDMRYYWISEIKTGNAVLSKNQRIVYGATTVFIQGVRGIPIGLPPGQPLPTIDASIKRCPVPGAKK